MRHLDRMTSERCFGCSACMAACSHQAIKIIRDEEGFYVPAIDAGFDRTGYGWC